MVDQINKIETYSVIDCPKPSCNFRFALPDSFITRRRADKKDFYCPLCAGSMSYQGESEKDREIRKLKEDVANAQHSAQYYRDRSAKNEQEAKHQEARANGYKGQLAKVKKRIANGICPCCNRYFENLHRHMQNKHAEFIQESGLISAMEAVTVEEFDQAVDKAVEGVSHSSAMSYRSVAGRIRRLMFENAR